MAINTLIIVLMFFLPLPDSSVSRKHAIYCIRPSVESPCPHEDCLTLSEYASNAARYSNNSDNLTLLFIPGEHVLNATIVFQQLKSVNLLTNQSFVTNITSNITCIEVSRALVMKNISYVKIEALGFFSCGGTKGSILVYFRPIPALKAVVKDTLPVISAVSVDEIYLESCIMEHNHLPLLLNKTVAYTSNSSFIGNTGSLGGVMAAYNSLIVFLGLNDFVNNEAYSGGAIFANNSALWFLSSANFSNNTAKFGGGVSLENSSIVTSSCKNDICNISAIVEVLAQHKGNTAIAPECAHQARGEELQFTGNHAGVFGGGICGFSSWFSVCGLAFDRNSAVSSGGAVAAFSSTLGFDFVTFVNNSATGSGGAVFLSMSKSCFGNKILKSAEQQNSTSQSNIVRKQVMFISNQAREGGGVDAEESFLVISGDYGFLSNNANDDGGAIRFLGLDYSSWCYLVGSGSFIHNTAEGSGGAIKTVSRINDYYAVSVELNGKMLMTNNSAATSGGAMSIAKSFLKISGTAVFEGNRADKGGGLHIDTSELQLLGLSKFIGNVAEFGGGALYSSNKAKITVNGVHAFLNNSATFGGGLMISCDISEFVGPILFIANASLTFYHNYAGYRGGAIFILDGLTPFGNCDWTFDMLNRRRACYIQFNSIELNKRPLLPSFYQLYERPPLLRLSNHFYMTNLYMQGCIGSVMFASNYAGNAGNSIYGGTLDGCRVELGPQFPCKYDECVNRTCYMSGLEAMAALNRMSVKQLTRDSLNVVSDSNKVCICDAQMPKCKQRPVFRMVYPGQTISLPLVAVGEVDIVIPGPVTIKAEIDDTTEVWLGRYQNMQTGTQCTPLTYTLFSNATKSGRLALSTEGPCGNLGIPLYVYMTFDPCPIGFAPSEFGSCICERRLQKYTNSCDITRRSFTRTTDFWLGSDSTGLILHPHCPFDYCILDTVSFTLNTSDLQCAHGRSGLLCGGCKSGLSLNLGSSHCSSCSNVFLLLFAPFAIAGILLVLYLFVFKVTVAAGTSSGLIFYANVIAVNQSVFFPLGKTNILTVFIAWLNLDLGIETCFIDGLDVYTRTWLQFVFPFYIWLLVGMVTLLCRYSIMVARIIGPTNPISVLATLFLLSYTKLLRTIIATFSFTTLDYPNDKKVNVWAYDGNVDYLGTKHIPLFMAGIVVFLFLFLPYTLLLLFGQWIQAGSNRNLLSWINKPKVRSFLDAYHAPYKNRHRYWPGLLLLLRFVIFLASTITSINSPRDPSVNLLVLGIVCIGMSVWVWVSGRVYKKRYNNFLEASFVLNLGILALASYQVKVEGGKQSICFVSSVSVAFATFLGIVSYHTVVIFKDSRIWRISILPRLQHFTNPWQKPKDPIELSVAHTTSMPPVTTTFVDLRESLLESQD